MNKSDIKSAINKLIPGSAMEHRISEKVLGKQQRNMCLKPFVSIAASLVVVIFIGVFGVSFWKDKHDNSSRPNSPLAFVDSNGAVNIPKIQLQKKSDSKANMIGLIVYQGRIYTRNEEWIEGKSAERLLGEKLGTTKGNINEWSSQKDYAVELASTTGIQDVYSVRGYDKSFRIMTIFKANGENYGEFYECLNGITVKTGADVFDKFKIENNIKCAKYEKYESWNNNGQQYLEVLKLEAVNSFAMELKNTKPYTQESMSDLFFQEGNDKQKFLYIILKDGSEMRLRLFSAGYVFYTNAHLFFKMDNNAFNRLWNELK